MIIIFTSIYRSISYCEKCLEMCKLLPYVLWTLAFAYTMMMEKNVRNNFAGMIVLLRNIILFCFHRFFSKGFY